MTGVVLGAQPAASAAAGRDRHDADRAIARCLIEGIPDHQLPELRRFLRATFPAGSAPALKLCERLTGPAGNACILADLSERDLFTRPLADQPDSDPRHHQSATALRVQHRVASQKVEQAVISQDLAHATDLAEHAYQGGDPRVETPSEDASAAMTLVLAAAATFNGDAETALGLLADARSSSGRDDRRLGAAVLLELLCLVALGRLSEAETSRRTALAVAAEDELLACSDIEGAWAEGLVRAGYITRGRAAADYALELWASSGAPARSMVCAAMRARAGVLLEAGELDRADAMLDQVLDISETSGSDFEVMPTLALQTHVALARDDPEEALRRVGCRARVHDRHRLGPQLRDQVASARLRAFVAMHDPERAAIELEWCTPGCSTRHGRARIELERGRRAVARRLLLNTWPSLPRRRVERHLLLARSWAGEEDDRASAHVAAADLLGRQHGLGWTVTHEVDLGRPALDRTPDTLSPAEMRVLQLLPSGATSREMAEKLYVSRETVRSHLKHIYAKLAVHDREAAVARARVLGLG